MVQADAKGIPRQVTSPDLGLQQVALLLTHARLRYMILAGKRCASVDALMLGMVQLHCNPL